MKDMTLLGIEQIFTSYNNPKGNAETERHIRTIKEEILWLNEFDTFEEAEQSITYWIEEFYNKKYVLYVLQKLDKLLMIKFNLTKLLKIILAIMLIFPLSLTSYLNFIFNPISVKVVKVN